MRRPPKISAATQSAVRAPGARREGAVILEAILVIPLLLILFFGIMEFGILMLIVAAATEATVDGAYTGSLLYPTGYLLNNNTLDPDQDDPTDNNDIADAVALQMDATLNAVSIEIRKTGVNDNAAFVNAYMRISRWNGVMVETTERGEITLSGNCPAANPAPGPNECVVQLCFPLISGAPVGKPVPNLLSVFQFTLSGEYFNATSRYQLQ